MIILPIIFLLLLGKWNSALFLAPFSGKKGAVPFYKMIGEKVFIHHYL